MKYVRLYGFDHDRTRKQFETTWGELQQALPPGSDGGFLLGVSENKLLLDGIPLESGQAERSFAQLLTTAGLASIQFASSVTIKDFERLVRVFSTGTSKAQDLTRQIKETFGDNKQAAIRINEVKFVAADPATGDVTIAAQIAAQTLGPEFKEWLNDPQKLLQLIAAAEGAQSSAPGGAPFGSVPNIPIGSGTGGGGGTGTGTGNGNGGGGTGSGTGTGGGGGSGTGTGGGPGGGDSSAGPGTWSGGVVPLQEEEVVQAIRLLTKFGEVGSGPQVNASAVQQEFRQVDAKTQVTVQQLLQSLAANVPAPEGDSPLLMRAAEHMAIRFALEKFQKGDVKVNAVHQMLEHMSRQMDTLRQILKVQEDKMVKAGILVESHADILDRMFWAEVPEAGKKSVLLSHDAPCVPSRNIRQFVESLLERNDQETAAAILRNYFNCLDSREAEPRRKTAIGISQLADLFSACGDALAAEAIQKLGQALAKENDMDLQGLISAAFVRLSSEASNRKQFKALNSVCAAMESIAKQRPVLVNDLRPRVGVENRLPEFIEEALRQPQFPPDLLQVLQRTSQSSIEHLADLFFRCMRREECDRMVELVHELGAPGTQQLRDLLRTGQTRQAAAAIGLLSRLDVPTLLELLPLRLKEWNRFYHDVVVRQIAYGAALDRGRTLLELLEILDPLVLPQALDEIGMSGDRTAAPPLMIIAESGQAKDRSALLQVKAIEALGRLREPDSVPMLRNLLDAKRRWKSANHREVRIAAAQALTKIDPRFGSQVISDSGLQPAELSIAPLDAAPACPWVRQRRYERIALPRSIPGAISSSWGRSNILIREMSLGGGMCTKEDSLRIGSDANLEISVGLRKKIRGQVLLRRARTNEIGFEIVNTDLESRYHLRALLMDAIERAPDLDPDWDGARKR